MVGSSPGVRPSDSELFVLHLAAELILATKSTAALSEVLPPYGMEEAEARGSTVLELLLRCQQVVTELIGVGKHGIMRLQSGDWSDLILTRIGIKYNSKRYKAALAGAESSLNAAMASRVFDRWAEAIGLIVTQQHEQHEQRPPAAAARPVPRPVLEAAAVRAVEFAAGQRAALRQEAWNGSWFSRAYVDDQSGWVGTTADDRLSLEVNTRNSL